MLVISNYFCNMKRILVLLTGTILTLLSCEPESTIDHFQGDWRKAGFAQKAFTVSGDSIYYPSLANGFLYVLDNDTLTIHFTNSTTQNPVLSLTATQMLIFDTAITQDTIRLEKINPVVPTE